MDSQIPKRENIYSVLIFLVIDQKIEKIYINLIIIDRNEIVNFWRNNNFALLFEIKIAS